MGLAPGVFGLDIRTVGTGPVAKLLAGVGMPSSVMPWGFPKVSFEEVLIALRADRQMLNDRGRVAEPLGFALTDPSMRLSRTRLFPKVTRAICVAPLRNE